jgi:hypothetical protein
MDAHVYALRSWTIKKKGEEFFIAATGQSGRTAGAGRTPTCNAPPQLSLESSNQSSCGGTINWCSDELQSDTRAQ